MKLESLLEGNGRPSRARGPVLADGSRIGIVGSGPAGAFFACFLLERARALDRRLEVEIFESRDFRSPAPAGCNMCGGVVSESLVQLLAAEGILLPPEVIQRGIDSYVLHMDVGSARIATPLQEMRVGAVHRGVGPRDAGEARWRSFDDFLQGRAVDRGATLVRTRVTGLGLEGGRPSVRTADGTTVFDLLVVAGGVNSDAPEMLEAMGIGYRAPVTARTFIREYFLGREALDRALGNSIHVFLLDLPHLEFAAVIPKGEYATVCLLGDPVDKKLADAFMSAPEVRACFTEDLPLPARSCQCGPRINVRARSRPFADRVLILGDCGVTRLYKDGIGAAYRTSKVAASCCIHHGISAASFARHFWPAARAIQADNRIGRFTFGVTRVIQRFRFTRGAMLLMVVDEQGREGRARRMSQVLWDIFTGSAPYRSVLRRTLHPAFLARLLASLIEQGLPPRGAGAGRAPSLARGGGSR